MQAGATGRNPELDAKVQEHLGAILASPSFANAERMRSLLTYLVQKKLAGDVNALKETIVGVEVFSRPVGYDPKSDGIVRVEAHRLRKKLDQYYAEHPENAGVRIQLPKGSYVLSIEVEEPIGGAAATRKKEAIIAYTLVGLYCVAGASVLTWIWNRPEATPPPASLRRITSDVGLTIDPTISQDGQIVVYASDRGSQGNLQLWRQSLAGGAATQITNGPFDDTEPWLSQNGDAVVYRSEREGGGLYRIPVEGGVPELLAKYGRRPRFSADGALVLYWMRDERFSQGRVYVVGSGGGEPRRVAADFADAHNPVWSRDGKAVLFCGTRVSGDPSQEHDWWVIPFPEGEPIKTGAIETFRAAELALGGRLRARGDQLGIPLDWAGSHLLFAAASGEGETLWRIEIPKDHRVRAMPERITFGTSRELSASAGAERVVFASGSQSVDIYELKGDTRAGRFHGPPRRLTSHPSAEFSPTLSADGRTLVYTADRGGGRRVYRFDLDSEQETPIDSRTSRQENPILSWDGRQLAFLSQEDARMKIMARPLFEGPEQVVAADAGAPTSWSPDGRWLLFEPGARIPFVGLLELATGRKMALLQSGDLGLRSARFSPDQKWVAFQADDVALSRKVMIAPFEPGSLVPPAAWIDVSGPNGPDYLPAWSPNGNILYFISERNGSRSIQAQRLDPSTKRPIGGAFAALAIKESRRSLLRNFRASVDRIGLHVAPDALVFTMDDTTANIWVAELR